ncbi:hypothetical protein [Halalkalibacter krulwichiae]|uniref:Uncharacterized protein n=1 Tax=Halalkalibacter krulwichiae TaxID=199441 RepID=A0A1X9M8V5_9BACI|nr:hypothetical protein [Halalkalibacter krulwichiae]ARK29889.1 hypothetical protein BkAM31D_08445 [Halalkalibacter krulwichiae]
MELTLKIIEEWGNFPPFSVISSLFALFLLHQLNFLITMKIDRMFDS